MIVKGKSNDYADMIVMMTMIVLRMTTSATLLSSIYRIIARTIIIFSIAIIIIFLVVIEILLNVMKKMITTANRNYISNHKGSDILFIRQSNLFNTAMWDTVFSPDDMTINISKSNE